MAGPRSKKVSGNNGTETKEGKMNIKEAIKSLESQRDQLSCKMKEDAANLKKLKETIRKLTKKAAEVDELLDSTPILDDTNEFVKALQGLKLESLNEDEIAAAKEQDDRVTQLHYHPDNHGNK
jgi:uncharacterized phage infection (PIP) family protein YhgE